MITVMVFIFLYKIRRLLQDLGPHTIVISYKPEPTIPGASYGPDHTCFLCVFFICLCVDLCVTCVLNESS